MVVADLSVDGSDLRSRVTTPDVDGAFLLS
jgi:hypothetical protein